MTKLKKIELAFKLKIILVICLKTINNLKQTFAAVGHNMNTFGHNIT